jgi:drug/metabolite transporter (DMT)-like permease
MNPTTLALILLSVTISAMAQISLKLGMSSAVVQHAITESRSDLFYAVVFNRAIVGGFTLYGIGAISWLFVLAKVDVSQAYPFMGLGLVMTFAIGYFILHEPITALRTVGMLLVVTGIGIVARS